MDRIDSLVLRARSQGCSDIHISQGMTLMVRVRGEMVPFPSDVTDWREVILSMLDDAQRAAVERGEDVDLAFTSSDGNRQRVNVFHQQGALAATVRLLNDTIPPMEKLGLPPVLRSLAELARGLVLITGLTGSGKSTTLASMVDHINKSRAQHILTIEDPVEYLYSSGMSLIHQREVGRDVPSFAAALRSALREDPDIILVGEMRDPETIAAALTAAETGHLVLSTLHTTGAAQTVDRIIDVCPAESQNQVRSQLASVLKGVVTQCLLPTADGMGRIVATEVMLGTDAIANMIRENKCHQIPSSMQAGGALGMHTLNADLVRLMTEGAITWDTAMKYSNDPKDLEHYKAR